MSKETTYKGMLVFASHDKTMCCLNLAVKEGYFLTTDLESSIDSPVFMQGKVDDLKDSIPELYNVVKGEKYFIIVKPIKLI